MKIIRASGGCINAEKNIRSIEKGTVFSGIIPGQCSQGVFIKGASNYVTRLDDCSDKTGGIYLCGDNSVIGYKELNAVVCIKQ